MPSSQCVSSEPSNSKTDPYTVASHTYNLIILAILFSLRISLHVKCLVLRQLSLYFWIFTQVSSVLCSRKVSIMRTDYLVRFSWVTIFLKCWVFMSLSSGTNGCNGKSEASRLFFQCSGHCLVSRGS